MSRPDDTTNLPESHRGAPVRTGADDFDFLIGEWRVRHRRLKERLTGSTEWIEFGGTTTVRKILGGNGNMDENRIDLPNDPYLAVTLRLFDPAKERWFIYWVDSRMPEALDPPMVGGFNDGRGVFYANDTFHGRPIRVRFLWSNSSAATCRWEQAFSTDGGESWETNWIMEFTRI